MTTSKTIHVRTVTGEPGRYFVSSESDPETEYLVDTNEFCGNGQCGCVDFATRRAPLLANDSIPRPETQCKHLNAVWYFKRYHEHQLRILGESELRAIEEIEKLYPS